VRVLLVLEEDEGVDEGAVIVAHWFVLRRKDGRCKMLEMMHH
jgi:hypothetical protein